MATKVKVTTCFFLLLIAVAFALEEELASVPICDFYDLYSESCRRNDGSTGECKHVERCPAAKEEIIMNNLPPLCGFQDRMPVVCCPRQQQPPTKPPTKPVTPSTKPPVSNPGNVGSKSKQKCIEYSKYVYSQSGAVPLLPDYEPPKDDKTDKTQCIHGETLILGGVRALPKEFPHMANIGFGEKDSISWLCGGSLISERFVMTAAHCLSARGLGLAKWIRLGELNIVRTDDATKTQDFAIEKMFRHPDYASPAHYNDIALIQIDRNANLDGYVRPACIHTEASVPGDKLIASGWGITDWVGSKGSDELLKVVLDIQDPTTCNETFAPLIGGRKLVVGVTPESMLCVGDLNGGKDTCKGDSGGPLQVRLDEPYCMYDVVGITSFGSICGARNSPAIYTRVSRYVPWIESIVWP